MTKLLYLGVGIPGSGKTTFLKPFSALMRIEYICPDLIRAELLGDALDQSKNAEIWLETYQRIGASLTAGKSVVLDSTMYKKALRTELFTFISKFADVKVIGYWFVAPVKLCISRNAARQRHVPLENMLAMNRSLWNNPPKIEEGFFEIHRITTIGQTWRQFRHVILPAV